MFSSIIRIAKRIPAVWVVLLVGLAISFFAFQTARSIEKREALSTFDNNVEDVTSAIEKRLQAYTGVLYGLQGLFSSRERLTRIEFKRYVDNLDIKHRYPGISILNFARFVKHADKRAYEETVRHDASRNPVGYPNFKINSAGDHADYLPIEYVEPEERGYFALGHDINGSEPSRRQAANLARDTGQLTTSGLLLPQLTVPRLFALPLRLAVYRPGMPLNTVEQRRAAYFGSVGTAFLINEVMRGALNKDMLSNLHVQMHDSGFSDSPAFTPPSVSNQLFDSSALFDGKKSKYKTRRDSADIRFSKTTRIDIGGRKWVLYFSAYRTNELPTMAFTWGTLFGGIVISSLLAGLVHSLATSRMRALKTAADMTRDLRVSEASLAEAQHMAHLGNWRLDFADNHVHLSEETFRILHLPRSVAMPPLQTCFDCIHEEDRAHISQMILRAREEGKDYEIEARVLAESVIHWVQIVAKVDFDERGQPCGLRGTIMDITAHKQLLEKVQYLALHDDLTALPNRALFYQQLGRAFMHAERSNGLLAILFIDLDRFKNINDTLGHDAGDKLLQDIALRLGSCLRKSDTVARLGGDEFVVLLEELHEAQAAGLAAQNVLNAVAQPFVLNEMEYHFTASIGISFYPQDGKDIQTLLKHADLAMYRAKEEGKNNFRYYSGQMSVRSLERVIMESSLRHALERDEFVLLYQPKIDIHTGRITGTEALLRWQHPTMGMISPTRFIPLAEETGLIVPIGEWVLQTACAQNLAWQKNGCKPVTVAVNLSARQFMHSGLLDSVNATLKKIGLDPACLDLEVTESMVMNDPEQAIAVLEAFRHCGILLSMDDFGTGYSSLSYFKRFPVNTLKIDQSFIRGIPHDPDDAAIVQAVIAMSHSLGIRVVAEGVENSAQLDFLRQHQCDEVQGFYFSHPKVAGEISLLFEQVYF